jgi:hypothetical protein
VAGSILGGESMIKVNHTDNVVSQSVKRFCHQVFWLRSVHRIYKELFESESSRELMDKTAQSFFNDLNVILINYLLLEFVKVTDPAVSKGEENLTIDNLIESIS